MSGSAELVSELLEAMLARPARAAARWRTRSTWTRPLPTSSHGLETIAGQRGARNWVLLVTQDDPPPAFELLEADLADLASRLALCLLPLTVLQSARLVDLVTEDRPLPPHVAEEVVRRCGGNPLFLFALLEHVQGVTLAGDVARLGRGADRSGYRQAGRRRIAT